MVSLRANSNEGVKDQYHFKKQMESKIMKNLKANLNSFFWN